MNNTATSVMALLAQRSTTLIKNKLVLIRWGVLQTSQNSWIMSIQQVIEEPCLDINGMHKYFKSDLYSIALHNYYYEK